MKPRLKCQKVLFGSFKLNILVLNKTALRSDVKLCPEFVLKGISLERGAERVISFVHVRDCVISFDDHIYAFDDDESKLLLIYR